jgi:hypothetical protein
MVERRDWRVQGLWRNLRDPEIIVTGLNSSTAGSALFLVGKHTPRERVIRGA